MRRAVVAAIVEAWRRRDAAALARATEGFVARLELDGLDRLTPGLNPAISHEDVLVTIERACRYGEARQLNELEIVPVWEAIQHHRGGCLAIRRDRRVGVEVGEHAIDALGATSVWFEVIAEPEPASAQERALMARIVDDPDDDELRLVLADHLLERDDPRGELIRLALADADPWGRYHDVARTYGPLVAGAVARHAEAFFLRRGLVDEVVMGAEEFRDHGERLLSEHPIRSLWACEHADLAALAAVPALARVRRLLLGAQRLLHRLAVSPHLGALRELEVRDCDTSDDDLAGLLGAIRAPALHTLTIWDVSVGPRALAALGANPGLPALRSLGLVREYRHDGAAIAALLGSPLGAQLESLRLNGLRIDDDVVTAIAASGAPALRHLDLTTTGVTRRGVDALIASALPALERVEIRSSTIVSQAELARLRERLRVRFAAS